MLFVWRPEIFRDIHKESMTTVSINIQELWCV
jgi:hypothetical protein